MTKAKIYLCLNYLTSPHNSCIKNETRVREAEGICKIEVPDGHISKYVCKIGKYNQRGIIFSCNTILVHMKYK